jgi:bifunctional non-homologous end joining protein LigD
MTAAAGELRIGGHDVRLTNLDKVLYPREHFTKGDCLAYYLGIADVMLPYLKDRPLTLKRYPNGVADKHFYEKQCPPFRPPWVKTIRAESKKYAQRGLHYCSVNDRASLAWVVNLASLEMHVLLSKAKNLNEPTAMVFDLDPGEPADILDCARIAIDFRKLLERLKLESFIKTSGGKGLHLYVPLNTRVTFEQTSELSHALAMLMERNDPKRIVSEMSKDLRRGKVFIDWSQNAIHKTTACVYSLRAKSEPTVSTPITWEELERAAKKRDRDALKFFTDDVNARLERHGDLFEPVLRLKQRLPSL